MICYKLAAGRCGCLQIFWAPHWGLAARDLNGIWREKWRDSWCPSWDLMKLSISIKMGWLLKWETEIASDMQHIGPGFIKVWLCQINRSVEWKRCMLVLDMTCLSMASGSLFFGLTYLYFSLFSTWCGCFYLNLFDSITIYESTKVPSGDLT